MRFNFVMKNHGATSAGEYLSPLTDYMRATLSKCGHETTLVQDEIHRDAINVFFEYFPETAFIDHVLELKQRHSLRIGVIATELMVGGTIPYGKHGMLWDGDKQAFFRNRVAGFERFARGADFVWSWLERTAHEYRDYARISRYFPVGHVFEVPAYLRRSPKDIDVIFFGTKTPHRAAILEHFRQQGIEVLCVGRGFPVGYLSKSYLSSLMDRAKIGLNLNLHAEHDTENGVDPRFASCMRITEMLGRELCVVSEEIPLDNPYRGFLHSDCPERLAEQCRLLLADGRWRGAGELSAAKFRAEMSVVDVCKPVVDATLSRIVQ
ncbi:MAG TPA: hypothetical protein VGY49_09355 [Burkholderiaceae bacterium]|jgi:hypothetical protein|nr:hypothetical protein [Burkholderiaceae bacterium]